MAALIPNIAKGSVAYYAGLPAASDALIAVLFSGSETDDNLRNADTLAAVIATGVNEATFTGYNRQTLTGVTVTVDDANDRVDVDANNPVWSPTSAEALTRIAICYDGDTGADLRGWVFANDDNSPLDGHGHGTHVAGTIAAVANNTRGVTGVMWNGQVMALKVLDDNGYGLLSDAVDALQYAVAKGVRVSNSSWGYSEYLTEEEADHNALRDAIAAARSQGHLFVAAAGNDSTDTDVTPHYPSSFYLDNIISVTASDNLDQLAWFASFGPASVDLAAPGDNVFSTYKLFG